MNTLDRNRMYKGLIIFTVGNIFFVPMAFLASQTTAPTWEIEIGLLPLIACVSALLVYLGKRL